MAELRTKVVLDLTEARAEIDKLGQELSDAVDECLERVKKSIVESLSLESSDAGPGLLKLSQEPKGQLHLVEDGEGT